MIAPERVGVYSDAVIGIMMTLLIVKVFSELTALRVAYLAHPGPSNVVANWLRLNAFQLAAFSVSFLMVALLWRMHTEVFRHFEMVNRVILWVNCLFLLIVSLAPFSTALLAQSHFDPLSIFFTWALAAVAIAVLWALMTYGMKVNEFRIRSEVGLQILHFYVLGRFVLCVGGMIITFTASAAHNLDYLYLLLVIPVLAFMARLRAGRILAKSPPLDIPVDEARHMKKRFFVRNISTTANSVTTFFSGYRPGRTLSFTDGVYAIALTLLASQIGPPIGVRLSTPDVVAVFRTTFSLHFLFGGVWIFIIVFILLQAIWLQHARIFALTPELNGRVLISNIIHLFCVTLIPLVFGIQSAAGRSSYLPWWLGTIAVSATALTMLPIAWFVLRNGKVDLEPARRVWRITVCESIFFVLFACTWMAPLGLLQLAMPCIVFKDPFVNLLWVNRFAAVRHRNLRQILFDRPILTLGSSVSVFGVSTVIFIMAGLTAYAYLTDQLMFARF